MNNKLPLMPKMYLKLHTMADVLILPLYYVNTTEVVTSVPTIHVYISCVHKIVLPIYVFLVLTVIWQDDKGLNCIIVNTLNYIPYYSFKVF